MREIRALSQQIQAARNQLFQLQQQLQQQVGSDGASNPPVSRAVAQLFQTLAAVEAATEDLHQQNDELLYTQRTLETECQRYQSMFAFAPDAYLVTNEQGIIQEGNRAAGVLLRIRCEHFVGQPLIRFVAEADWAFVDAQLDCISQVIQSQLSQPRGPHPANVFLQDQEITVRPQQGTAFPASLAISAELDYQGQVRLYWVFRDLRERQRLEAEQQDTLAALQTSEEQRRLALDLTQTGWWDWNIVTDQLIWSNHLFQLLGYAPDEVIPNVKTWRDRIHPDDLEWSSQALEWHLANQTVGEVEYRVIHPDGSLHWLLVKGQGIYDESGRPVRMVGIALDISDRKRLETGLQESEARYRLLSDMSPLGIFRHDAAGRCTYVNERILQLVDRPLEACLGLNWIETIHPDDRQQIVASLQAFMAEAANRPEAIHQLECRHLHASGKLVWVWSQVATERDTAGNITGYVGTLIDITERKQLESALQLSEERLRLVLDLNQIGSWDWYPTTAAVHWNTHNYRLLGYQPEEVEPAYERWLERVHPDDVVEIEQHLIEALATQTDWEDEYRILLSDGTVRWLLSRGRGIYNEAGLLLRVVGATLNVTKLRQAEAELLDQKRFVENIVATVPNIIYILDIQEHRTIYASCDGNADLGYAREEYQQWGSEFVARIMHPDDLQRLGELFNRWDTADDEQILEAEIRLQKKDGTWVWHWLCEKVFQRDASGRVRQIIGTAYDITEHKQLELSLRASEVKLSRILDSSIAVVVSFKIWDNRDWEYEYWSAGYEELYGFTVEEMQADKYLWLSQVLPEDREAVILPLLDRFLTEPKIVVEYRFRRKDGSIRWICSIYASEQIEPNCWMITSVNYDVNDRKQLELELLQINAELEQRVRARTRELEQAMQAAEAANQAKSTFLANMSHELRTPLNAILGFSQLLGRDVTLGADQQEQIGIINRSGEHLLNLINDILEISRIEAGQSRLTTSDLALEGMLNHLADLFQLKAESKGIALIIQTDATVPPYIQVDEGKLRQVLINLLSNAIKFTQAGTVTLHVQLGERKASRAADPPDSLLLYFSVADTGPGIDPLEHEMLFQPFVQTQTGFNAQEGTGLGLPISREFVRLLGGELSLISTPGQGATFYFQIPVVPIGFSNLPDQSATRKVIGLASDQPRYRVLVAENNRDNGQFLVQLLRSVGFEVQSAENGEEAVTLWQQWQPDLIWMDMQMPVMDGYQATQQIREREAGFGYAQPTEDGEAENSLSAQFSQTGAERSRRPIIALTASAFESERAAILAVGCTDLVCKPATADLLLEKMAEHLGVRYRYAENKDPFNVEQVVEGSQAQLLAVLQTMPTDWMLQLQQAVRVLDEELILQLLNQIPSTEILLAQTLKAWVNEFRFDKLLDLVDVAQVEPG